MNQAFAQENQSEIIKSEATANVGFYLTNLYDLDIKQKSFKTVGYMWWNLNPSTSKYSPYKTTEIINQKEGDIIKVDTFNAPGGYYQAKVIATINANWDLHKFPFDRQKLQIYFEDSGLDVRGLQYAADFKNSGVKPNLQLDDWRIISFSVGTKTENYYTNFGDRTAAIPGSYSRFIVNVDIARKNSAWLFFYLFIGSFVAAILCTLGFFTNLDSDIRFNLFVASVFATVTNQYLLYNVLPRTSYLTLGDKVQIATFILLIMTMVIDVTVKKIAEKKQVKRARSINNKLGFTICISYAIYIGYVLTTAISH